MSRNPQSPTQNSLRRALRAIQTHIRGDLSVLVRYPWATRSALLYFLEDVAARITDESVLATSSVVSTIVTSLADVKPLTPDFYAHLLIQRATRVLDEHVELPELLDGVADYLERLAILAERDIRSSTQGV